MTANQTLEQNSAEKFLRVRRVEDEYWNAPHNIGIYSINFFPLACTTVTFLFCAPILYLTVRKGGGWAFCLSGPEAAQMLEVLQPDNLEVLQLHLAKVL